MASLTRGDVSKIDTIQKLLNIESDVSDIAMRITNIESIMEQLKQQMLINMESDQKILALLTSMNTKNQPETSRIGRSKTPNPVTSPRFLQPQQQQQRSIYQTRPKTPVAPKIVIPTSPHRNRSAPLSPGSKRSLTRPLSPSSPISPTSNIASKNRPVSPVRFDRTKPRRVSRDPL